MGKKKGKKLAPSLTTIQYDSSEIKKEARKALRALVPGNQARALSMIKKSCQRYPNSGDLYGVQAAIYDYLVTSLEDSELQSEYHNKAVDSARMAVSLSPNSVHICLFYVYLLLRTCDRTSIDENKKILDECKRGLAIEQHSLDPVDKIYQSGSAGHILSYVDERGNLISSPTERIAHVRKELTSLKKIMSSIVGEGGDNEEGEKLQKISDEPSEGNIKKATKAETEMRRKEIGARVLAAQLSRYLQSQTPPQKSESPEENLENPQSSSRMVEHWRKKNMEKLLSLQKKKERLTAYWNSNMSEDDKQNFLTLNVKGLLAYYNTPKEKLAHQVLSQAVSFAKDHKNWIFEICCECDEAFSDSGLHLQHVVDKHVQGLPTQQNSVLPYENDQDWISMIKSGTWKPINMSEAETILKNRWEEVSNLKLSENESRHWARSQMWPLSDDSDRVQSLERIQVLLKNIRFAKEHLSLVIKFTMKKLQRNHPGLRIYEVGLNETHFCICMLGESELERICTFFGELRELSKTDSSVIPEIVIPRPVNQIKERMVLDGDSLCLLLDEQSLQSKSNSVTFFLDSDRRDRGLPSSDALLSWIFSGLSIEEELESWVQIEEDKRCCGNKLVQTLQKTYQNLGKICVAKHEKLSYKEALKAIWGLCLEEVNKRNCGAEYVPQSLKEVLWKRQQELVVQKNYDSGKYKSELDAISSLLEAQQENVTQEQTRISSIISSVCDLNTLEDVDITLQNYLDQDDICVLEEIERVRISTEFELIKYDVWIMPTVVDICQVAEKIVPFATNDYRAVLLPLVKSYIQAQLEKLVYKDAEDKSDAVKDTLLAEVMSKDQKSLNKGGKQSKQEKKLQKSNQKHPIAEIKISEGNEQLLQQGTPEQACTPDGHQDVESVGASTGEDLEKRNKPIQQDMKEVTVLPTDIIPSSTF